VKKNDKENTLINKVILKNKDSEVDKIKTTNVNILLNRVKLDRKKTLKKRIYFSLLIAALISSFVIYSII
tara:strand:- start:116 stop:325 length:210 start_codon:yes stop_codon:yes gene_type:complete